MGGGIGVVTVPSFSASSDGECPLLKSCEEKRRLSFPPFCKKLRMKAPTLSFDSPLSSCSGVSVVGCSCQKSIAEKPLEAMERCE